MVSVSVITVFHQVSTCAVVDSVETMPLLFLETSINVFILETHHIN